MPEFQKFNEKIALFKEVKLRIKSIKDEVEIHWLRVKADPLKKALEINLNEWIFVFVNFLNVQVKTFIQNCIDFEKYLKEGISKNPQDEPEN